MCSSDLVVKIDERLENYKAAVKTLLHPAGMKLFGEYNITNNFNLSVALECMVKVFGVVLADSIDTPADQAYLTFTKTRSDSVTMTDAVSKFDFTKYVSNHYLYGGLVQDTNSVSTTETWTHSTTKSLNSHYLYDGVTADTNAVSVTESVTSESGKGLADSFSMSDTGGTSLNIDKSLTDSFSTSQSGEVDLDSRYAETPSTYFSEYYSEGYSFITI